MQRSQQITDGSQQITDGASRPKARQLPRKSRKPVTGKSKSASPAGPNSVALPPQLVAAQAEALASALAASQASAEALGFYRIPLFLLPVYKAAAARYGVPWQILAAINEVETNYGTDLSLSSAGAEGWMQFMPGTWLQYGVDALDAGYADPYNPVDAIFAAARYLRAAGAASDLRSAILAYNHSQAYLESVLLRAKLISSYPASVIATLTGLIDARPPVTGAHVSWEAPTQPTPARAKSQRLKLVRVRAAANASVVAVQDGRIVDVGRSRRLGRFVVLRDVYGDEFTYAALGSIARSYASQPQHAGLGFSAGGARGVGYAIASSPAATSAGVPTTLAVTPIVRHRTDRTRRANAAPLSHGKVRLYAHPGNPDAVFATMSRGQSRTSRAGRTLPLRSGALVWMGTVLGGVNVPAGASEGRISFAIRPAGDDGTIDPRPLLSGWAQLATALHPQGAKAAEALLGATASSVLSLSRSQLQQALLSDPGVTLDARSRAPVAAGAVDPRVLAALAFLSRCGLRPTASLPGEAGAGARGGHVAVSADISAINGIAIAAHQGANTITDLAIRTLLALPVQSAPRAIWSLMRYPGAPRTHASTADAKRIRIEFQPTPGAGTLPASPAGVARTAKLRAATAVPPPAGVHLSAAQWEQLIERISSLPAPSVARRPSSAAVPDASTPSARH